MTTKDIFSKMSTRMLKALMFHNDYIDVFCFMGLKGFERLNERRYKEESANMRKLHEYFIETHNMLLSDYNIDTKSEIMPEWREYARTDIDATTKAEAVKVFITKWLAWENETKQELEKAYIELMEIEEVTDALEIKKYLCDVCDELKHATGLYLKLKLVNFDINTILSMQEEKRIY